MTKTAIENIDVSSTDQLHGAPPPTELGATTQVMQAIKGLEKTAPQTYAHLRQALSRDDARVVISIPPHLVRPSKYANRAAESMQSPAFQELKDSIKTSNGNSQPILVRPVTASNASFATEAVSDAFLYEIVSGHRRHLVCRELGLRVSAIVVPDMDDRAMVLAMHLENHARSPLSPWEFGQMLAGWLDGGLFKSLHEVSKAIGRDIASISRAVSLVRLPAIVVSAFESPMVLQYKDADVINLALGRNRVAVIAVAEVLSSEPKKLSRTEVLKRLVQVSVDNTSVGPTNAAMTDDLKIGTRVAGAIQWDAQGQAKVTIKQSVSKGAQKELHQFLVKLLKRDFRSASVGEPKQPAAIV